MTANRKDVDRWIEHAIKNNFEFIISVCNTWDWEDYPVFCRDKEQLVKEYTDRHGKDMLKINEIIKIVNGKAVENLTLDKALE